MSRARIPPRDLVRPPAPFVNALLVGGALAACGALGGCDAMLGIRTGEAEEGSAPSPTETTTMPGATGTDDGGADENDGAEAHDAGADAPSLDAALEDAGRDAEPDGAAQCRALNDCAAGFNCRAGRCTPAVASCAAQKLADEAAPDGVYWINPRGSPLRAYCDMRLRAELCTELEEEHRGKTRDGANLAYIFTSILLPDAKACVFWALRASGDGLPLTALAKVKGNKLDTCQALGFVRDDALASCIYGDLEGYGTCGFPGTGYYFYGNVCSGCATNNGEFANYVVQGPIHSGKVLSDWQGRLRSRCRVQ